MAIREVVCIEKDFGAIPHTSFVTATGAFGSTTVKVSDISGFQVGQTVVIIGGGPNVTLPIDYMYNRYQPVTVASDLTTTVRAVNAIDSTLKLDNGLANAVNGAYIRVDNTAAVQAAIDKARETGLPVYTPAKRYFINGPLKRVNKVTIFGESVKLPYWQGKPVEEGGYGDVFFENASVWEGANSAVPPVLIQAIGQGYHAKIHNMSFYGYKNIATPDDPREYLWVECNFRNFIVLDAPANKPDKYLNHEFDNCNFTSYGVHQAVFGGRAQDCKFRSCVFLGAAGFALTQARAINIFDCRFEWIDRGFAISLLDCSEISITGGCLFDRVAGCAINFEEKNAHITISGGNIFNRCGGLYRTNGEKIADPTYACFFRIREDQQDILFGDDNVYIAAWNTDKANPGLLESEVVCPPYIFAKRAHNSGVNPNNKPAEITFNAGKRDLSFAATKGAVFIEAHPDLFVIDTESTFNHLTQHTVDLAKYSRAPIVAYNDGDAAVSEIPPMLTVQNAGTITLTGAQKGAVFGGKVNGKPRYTQPEKIGTESTQLTQVFGDGTYRDVEYSLPIGRGMLGAPLTVTMLYKTSGSIDGSVEISDAAGNVVATLPNLTASAGSIRYTGTVTIPESLTPGTYKLSVYCTKDAVLGAGAYVKIDAYMAAYGDLQTRAFTDKL